MRDTQCVCPCLCSLLVVMQWCSIDIETDQHRHHGHRASKHRDRPEYPQQKIRSEIDGTKAHQPKIAPSDHLLLNAVYRDIVIRHANKEVSMNEVPRRLNKASKCHQKACEQRNVLDVNHRRISAPVDKSAGEEIHRRAPDPCSD